MSGRNRKLVCILGACGVGKSSLFWSMANDYMDQGGNVLIISPNPDVFGGGDNAYWPPGGSDEIPELLASLKGKFHGLIMFDDADICIEKHEANKKGSIVRSLFSSYRHWGVDVVVNLRSVTDFPNLFFRSVTNYAIFQQNEGRAIERLQANVRGHKIMDLIPTEPYQYVWIDATGKREPETYETVPLPFDGV